MIDRASTSKKPDSKSKYLRNNLMFFPARPVVGLTRWTRHMSHNPTVRGTIWTADAYLPPIEYHPRPHGIPAALLHFRSHHPKLLELFTWFATHSASALGIPVSKPAYLPTKRTLWTVPKGPFAHKKSQENYDRKVHKRAIKAWDADPEVVGIWVRYLEENHVPGVGLRVVRWERAPVGFGATRMEWLNSQLEEVKRLSVRGQVESVGEEIIKTEMQVATVNKEKPQ